ncbi:MAG: GDP-mannose 4,6-dehydratase [Halieaceae bacterium]
MNWLITGGCGFIGRSLVARLLFEDGHAIRIFDNLAVGTRDDLATVVAFNDANAQEGWSNGVTLVVGDIKNREDIASACKDADVIVHLAANTGVGPSVENPFQDCETNVIGTLNVLEAARSAGNCRVVFASSGAPLGVQQPPLHEELAPHPASPYGASKLSGEGYCSAYYHCFGVETVVLRFGNVYGPRSGHKMSLVAKFTKQALDDEPLEIYGDGKQTRDFIFIDDLVDAVFKSALVDDVGGETFQIATARETTVYELTEALVAALSKAGVHEPKITYGEKRAGDVERNYSDTTKAAQLLGWQAETDLTDGLQATVNFFCKAEK